MVFFPRRRPRGAARRSGSMSKRTAQAVVARLRTEPRADVRVLGWIRPAWLRMAAALVIVVRRGSRRGEPVAQPTQGRRWSRPPGGAETISPPTAAEVLEAMGQPGGEPESFLAGRQSRRFEHARAASAARVPGRMNERLAWIVMITLASALAAQEPATSGLASSVRAGQQLRHGSGSAGAARAHDAGLSDEQTTKLQGTEQRFEEQRQPLRARQRESRDLNGELAAGTPNQEHVKQLMNERQENQRKLQEINRSEDREMQAYLSPVQRARYQEERRSSRSGLAKSCDTVAKPSGRCRGGGRTAGCGSGPGRRSVKAPPTPPHARSPNAVASARSATARARARAPSPPAGSTSKARHGESDHAIANTAPHRRQRAWRGVDQGLRSQQLGQTAYFHPRGGRVVGPAPDERPHGGGAAGSAGRPAGRGPSGC